MFISRKVLILLEKKLKNDIDVVNSAVAAEGIPSTDQSRDVVRSLIKGCTSFESAFDSIIEAGKKEIEEKQPKSGKKEKINQAQGGLRKAYT